MKTLSLFGFASATALCVFASTAFSAGYADETASPIYGVTIPAGYRQWELVSVAHEAGDKTIYAPCSGTLLQ